MKFIINGIVKKGMTNTKLMQDNKIINLLEKGIYDEAKKDRNYCYSDGRF